MSQAEQGPPGISQITGQVIGGRYRLGEKLGQGGMGVVYEAMQESLARPVAVKVLQPMLAQNGESILRFKAEAERAGRLAHPHIVQILDFGHEPGASAWIAMELLKGESLAARIERGWLSEAEVVRIAKETLSALEAAHAANLVHRDLKPDNIFLADVPGIGASVKVLDFGIAKLLDDESAGKLTATGMLIGTPLYMAPEQARGADVDQRADLYALGAVLYEALTGRPPFHGKNYNALLYSVLNETPAPITSVRPDVSPELGAVIARAMERDPKARWESASAMAQALRALRPSEQIPMARVPSYAPLATAPTVATPSPADPLGATTAVQNGASAGVLTGAATVPRSAPLARATSAGAARTDTKPAPGLRWWPLALAGGLLAAAALAFVRTSSNSGPSSAAMAVVAPVAVPSAQVTLTPVAPVAQGTPSQILAVAPTSPASSTPTTGAIQVQPMTLERADDSDEMRPARPVRRVMGRPASPALALRDSASPAPASTASASTRSVPRPHVGRAGGIFGLLSSDDVAGAVGDDGWADCWPAGVPGPESDRLRVFRVEVAADGHVLTARVAPNSEDPIAFSSCVVAKLRRLSFPSRSSPEVADVQIHFAIENR